MCAKKKQRASKPPPPRGYSVHVGSVGQGVVEGLRDDSRGLGGPKQQLAG